MLKPTRIANLSLFFAAFVLFSGVNDAKAYDNVSIRELWDRFVRNCEQVITSPNEYIEQLVVPDKYGARVISVSPDGNSTSIFNRVENSYDQIIIQRIHNKEIRDCSVYGEYWAIDSRKLADDFSEIIQLDPVLNISGGHTPQEFYGEDSNFKHDNYYIFTIQGAWENENWLASGQIVEGEVQLFLRETVTLE